MTTRVRFARSPEVRLPCGHRRAENSRLQQRLADLCPTFTTAQAHQALLSSGRVEWGEVGEKQGS
ncbi:hypothetical protein FGD71_042455 [Streptomyces sporangiiformans]|uniref:Uncharacterized protein n=1 Tax=Streptomyces sporangiiformans TaxID=2315329 RepID=A0A505CXM8_9ACTN|nr:hypothetical protein FGD71_042455 [Streptomyces sporangiiformans]